MGRIEKKIIIYCLADNLLGCVEVGLKTIQSYIFIMAIMALAIVCAGCTEEDIGDMVREQAEQEIRNQTIGRVEHLIQDVGDSVNNLLGGGSGNDGDSEATERPTESPDATISPGPVSTSSPTPRPLTDADNAIHVTATLDVLVVDQKGNPLPDRMVYFNALSWTEKDPKTIMLEKRTDSDGKASFTIGYNLIDNDELFAKLGKRDYVDYLAMSATTSDVRFTTSNGEIETYIDRYWTDHWVVITYPQASEQAGELKYAAISRSLKLWVMNDGYEHGSPNR
jgi:hypothetical protein